MPLPGSPMSESTGEDTSTSHSYSATDSEGELITPRPGPSAPELRTQAALSRPTHLPADAFHRTNSFREWKTDNIKERLELTDEESIPDRITVQGYNGASPGKGKEPARLERPRLGISSQLQFSTIVTVASSAPAGPASASTSSNPSSSSRVARPRTSSLLGQKFKDFKIKHMTHSATSSGTTRPATAPQPERTPSITFHPSSYTTRNPPSSTGRSPNTSVLSTYASARRASPRGSIPDVKRLTEETESSADENTAIVRRPSATYGTAPIPSGYDGAGEEDPPRRASKAAPTDSPRPQSRWRALADKYGSVELENKGSVARDHLALERTFLAWLRTSLSFASIGIAVTQLFRLSTSLQQQGGNASITSGPHTSAFLTALVTAPELQKLSGVGKPLGAVFLGVAILVLFVGFHRYFEAQHYVIRGKFPASRGSVVLVSTLSGALIVVSFAVVLGLAPASVDDA